MLGLARWGALILAVTDAAVVAVEWGLDEAGLPIAVPLGPVFTGGYFQAEFDPTLAGLAPGDVELVVEEGPDAAAVSAGKAALGPAGQRHVRVLAGPIPGEYHLSAINTLDGSRLGSVRFRVTSHWPDDEVGPPVAVTGERQVFMKGGWGGGPGGPQNVRVHPAPDNWRVAVVLVSTRDRRFPANSAPCAGHVAGPHCRPGHVGQDLLRRGLLPAHARRAWQPHRHHHHPVRQPGVRAGGSAQRLGRLLRRGRHLPTAGAAGRPRAPRGRRSPRPSASG